MTNLPEKLDNIRPAFILGVAIFVFGLIAVFLAYDASSGDIFFGPWIYAYFFIPIPIVGLVVIIVSLLRPRLTAVPENRKHLQWILLVVVLGIVLYSLFGNPFWLKWFA